MGRKHAWVLSAALSAGTAAVIGGAGCSSDVRGGDGLAVGPADPGTACQRLFQGYCDHLERCGCDAQRLEECRSLVDECDDPETDPPWPGLLASGDFAFDEGALQKTLAKLKDPKSPCIGIFTDIGANSVTAYTFGGMLTGTHRAGELCHSRTGTKGGPSDCVPGTLCRKFGDADPVCVSLVGRGAACDTGDAPASLCFLERPPDSDDEFESAFDTLTCVPDSPGAARGTCKDQLENGTVCASSRSCKSGLCQQPSPGLGMCTAKLAAGVTCSVPSDCASGACADSVCGPKRPNGAVCDYFDENCQSGVCNTTDTDAKGTCIAPGNAAFGAACEGDGNCKSRACRNGKCVTELCD